MATEDYPFSIPQFTDILDSASSGICGSKIMTLAKSPTNAFLTLSQDDDTITFDYDMSRTK